MTDVDRMSPAEVTGRLRPYPESRTIFARFGADTQDSGNISYGVPYRRCPPLPEDRRLRRTH